jgi:hypothetical protein
MRAEGEATLQERKYAGIILGLSITSDMILLRNALSIVTSNRDTTPSTQLTFPIAQVQSPVSMLTPYSFTSLHICIEDDNGNFFDVFTASRYPRRYPS